MMSLREAQQLLPGAQLIGASDTRFTRVHTDTRTLAAGDLFVALKGENFDAHSFLPQLKTLGCAAVIAERDVESAGIPALRVSNSRKALGDLAYGWRNRFNLPLIAVTGSNGKTTVTQLIASILAAAYGEEQRLATQGNYNNDVGLPLTLLRLKAEHRAAVVEIGMNHIGEVASLAKIAAPTVALVNNAQREHQEFMGTVEATARENGAVFEALKPRGIAVFPMGGDQSAYTAIWKQQAGGNVRCVGFSSEASSNAEVLWATQQDEASQTLSLHSPWGNLKAALTLLGAHNAHNAAAAATAALAAGVPLAAVVQGLENFQAVKGRLVRKDFAFRNIGNTGAAKVAVIDDTYNANPDSVLAAIDVLAAMPAPRWLVLGDMGEVGERGAEFHQEMGEYARDSGINWLFGLGVLSTYTTKTFDAKPHQDGRPHAAWFENRAALAKGISDGLAQEKPASILIKGSRFMQMEEFVAHTHAALNAIGGVTC